MSNSPTGLLKWTAEHVRLELSVALMLSAQRQYVSYTRESQIQTCEDKYASQGPDFTDVSLLGKYILLRS